MHVEIWKTTEKFRPWVWAIRDIPTNIDVSRFHENIKVEGRASTEYRAKSKGCRRIMKLRKLGLELEKEYTLKRDTKKKVECE